MKHLSRFMHVIFFITISSICNAQSIYGKVVDNKKQPIISAIIQAFQGGTCKGGAATDYEGNYEIKPLDTGVYSLVLTYIGYDTEGVKNVFVKAKDEVKVNFQMNQHYSIHPQCTKK